MNTRRRALLGAPAWVLLLLALARTVPAGPHRSAPLQQVPADPAAPESREPRPPLDQVAPGKVEVVFAPEAVHDTFIPEPRGPGIERLDLSPEEEKILLDLRLGKRMGRRFSQDCSPGARRLRWPTSSVASWAWPFRRALGVLRVLERSQSHTPTDSLRRDGDRPAHGPRRHGSIGRSTSPPSATCTPRDRMHSLAAKRT